jgi:hypothetical protein
VKTGEKESEDRRKGGEKGGDIKKGEWGQVERRADADVERTMGKSRDNRNEE